MAKELKMHFYVYTHTRDILAKTSASLIVSRDFFSSKLITNFLFITKYFEIYHILNGALNQTLCKIGVSQRHKRQNLQRLRIRLTIYVVNSVLKIQLGLSHFSVIYFSTTFKIYTAQWQNMCLLCTRPLVLSPAS